MPEKLIDDPQRLRQYLQTACAGGCGWGEVEEFVSGRFAPSAITTLLAQQGQATSLEELFNAMGAEELRKGTPDAADHLIQRGVIGFYRPDPSGNKSPNVILQDHEQTLEVFEVTNGMVFTIDKQDWMSMEEMKASTAALKTDPRYVEGGSMHDLLERMLKGRALAIQDAINWESGVQEILALHPANASPLRTFEVTGAGFDGGTGKTDDHVMWIEARSAVEVKAAIEGTGAEFHDAVDTIDDIGIDFCLPEDLHALRQKLEAFQRKEQRDLLEVKEGQEQHPSGTAATAGAAFSLNPAAQASANGAATNGISLETIAAHGSITVSHDSSRGNHDSNGYEITVKGPAGETLIGTLVHDDELTDLVGTIMANELRQNVSLGKYITCYSSLEVMGLRGSLAERIAANDWSVPLEGSLALNM